MLLERLVILHGNMENELGGDAGAMETVCPQPSTLLLLALALLGFVGVLRKKAEIIQNSAGMYPHSQTLFCFFPYG